MFTWFRCVADKRALIRALYARLLDTPLLPPGGYKVHRPDIQVLHHIFPHGKFQAGPNCIAGYTDSCERIRPCDTSECYTCLYISSSNFFIIYVYCYYSVDHTWNAILLHYRLCCIFYGLHCCSYIYVNFMTLIKNITILPCIAFIVS